MNMHNNASPENSTFSFQWVEEVPQCPFSRYWLLLLCCYPAMEIHFTGSCLSARTEVAPTFPLTPDWNSECLQTPVGRLAQNALGTQRHNTHTMGSTPNLPEVFIKAINNNNKTQKLRSHLRHLPQQIWPTLDAVSADPPVIICCRGNAACQAVRDFVFSGIQLFAVCIGCCWSSGDNTGILCC